MEKKNRKILEMSQRQDVQPDELAEYIYSKINFTLPYDIWIGINNGYAEFYNSLSAYDSFYENDAFRHMLDYLSGEKLLFPVDRLRIIHEYIFDYLAQEEFVLRC